MIDINIHPIWKKVNPIKKRGHLLRFFLAKQMGKMIAPEKVVAVTGSVGKTTTIEACAKVLSVKKEVLATIPNLDPIFNIPITILKYRPKYKKVILEMGVEYPGEMDYYMTFVEFNTAIVTSVYFQHSEFLGSIDEIAKEKSKIVKNLPKSGIAILNWDDARVRKMAEETQAEIVYFGTDAKNCHVWAGNIRIVDLKTKFELNYGVERVEITSKLLGTHQIYSMLAAAAFGISEGLSLTTIKRSLESILPVEHRMNVVQGFNNSIILDDSYNAAPISVEAALDTLNQIMARRRIVVLGEMRELGEYSKRMHEEVARKIFKEKFDLVLLGTGSTQYVYDELIKLGFIEDRIFFGLQNSQMVGTLLKILAKGDVVLVKGARNVRLDEVVQRISKK